MHKLSLLRPLCLVLMVLFAVPAFSQNQVTDQAGDRTTQLNVIQSVLEAKIAERKELRERIVVAGPDDIAELEAELKEIKEVWFPASKGDYIMLPDGKLLGVLELTTELIQLQNLAGTNTSIPAADFYDMTFDNLSTIARDACGILEFDRADEMITLGYESAAIALDIA